MAGVPLPKRQGRNSWDEFIRLVRQADGDDTGRYSPSELTKIHTAVLLINREHPTQKMSKKVAQQIAICLSEYHEATKPLFDPRRVDDDYGKKRR